MEAALDGSATAGARLPRELLVIVDGLLAEFKAPNVTE